jgi:toxin-antitoxin system PIN domain toxin
VTIPDVNVLLYAYDEASPQHESAKRWLEEALSSTEPTAFPWASLLGFIRIATQPAIYPSPLSLKEALDILDEWLAHPHVAVVHPGRRHAALLREVLTSAGVAGDLTTDAHLAAIAIEHGATLATFDADFHRFAGLKLEYLG